MNAGPLRSFNEYAIAGWIEVRLQRGKLARVSRDHLPPVTLCSSITVYTVVVSLLSVDRGFEIFEKIYVC